jgi:hypothetical protein
MVPLLLPPQWVVIRNILKSSAKRLSIFENVGVSPAKRLSIFENGGVSPAKSFINSRERFQLTRIDSELLAWRFFAAYKHKYRKIFITKKAVKHCSTAFHLFLIFAL